MTDDELKQLIASNARSIQAAADERAELRLAMGDVQEAILDLRQIVIRLADIQNGITNLLARLDDDRPTILRKLNSIEDKVDRLLDNQGTEQN